MDLSIIIVNFNTKKLILDCIKSILFFPPRVGYEIVVIDNASSDDSVNALEKFKTSKRLGAKLRIIKNEENLGFAKANNVGIKSAHGRYVLLLNSDTKVKKNSVDNLYNFASTKSFAGVVGPKLLNGDGSVQSSIYHFPTAVRAIREFWLGERGAYEKYKLEGDEPVAVDALVMAAFLLTPRVISEVGLLDERYFMYFEDLDYCRKVKSMGLKVYYLPNSEIVHLHGRSGGKSDLLIASSKAYHGFVKYLIITFIIWSRQKWEKLLKILR